MKIGELTLWGIDNYRATSQDLVSAVAFAARSGYNDTFCFRFASALAMTGQLHDGTRGEWLRTLNHIKRLEAEEA